MLKKSKRNRHTGKVNSITQMIINRGEHMVIGGRPYIRYQTGNIELGKTGFTLVRMG